MNYQLYIRKISLQNEMKSKNILKEKFLDKPHHHSKRAQPDQKGKKRKEKEKKVQMQQP